MTSLAIGDRVTVNGASGPLVAIHGPYAWVMLDEPATAPHTLGGSIWMLRDLERVAPTPQPAEPAGEWKLMPREPTEAQIAATYPSCTQDRFVAITNYRAMWSAAPSADPTAEDAREWQPIETAPRDRLIEVYATGHDLPALVCLCQWHEDAGFCVCELREPTHWREHNPPAPPADFTHFLDGKTTKAARPSPESRAAVSDTTPTKEPEQ